MSTAVATPTERESRPVRTAHTPPTAAALARVELRKMVDTRAGRWLLIVAAALAVVASVAVALAGDAEDRGVWTSFQATLLPAGVLLPVIGILAATGEWSQRTALSTYALVPRRERILAAKAIAVLALGLAGVVVGLLAAVLGGVVAATAGDAPDPWAVSLGDVLQAVLFQELNVLWGLGFGLLLFAPAVAIVSFFVLPTVFTLVASLGDGLQSTLDWVDPNRALAPLTDGATDGADWARIAAASAVWIGVPLVLGTIRTLRREVK